MINFRAKFRKRQCQPFNLNKISINYNQKIPQLLQPIKKRHKSLTFTYQNKFNRKKFSSSNHNFINYNIKSSRYAISTLNTQNQKDQLDFSDHKIKNLYTKSLSKQNKVIQTLSNQKKYKKTYNQTVSQNQHLKLIDQSKVDQNIIKDEKGENFRSPQVHINEIFKTNKIPLNYQKARQRKNIIKDQKIQNNRTLKAYIFPELKIRQKDQLQISQRLSIIQKIELKNKINDDSIIGWEEDSIIADMRKSQITQYLQKQQQKDKHCSLNLYLQDQKILSPRNKYKTPQIKKIVRKSSIHKNSKSISLRASKQI